MDSTKYYPGRCQDDHVPVATSVRGSHLILRGRLVEWDGTSGVIQDMTGKAQFQCDPNECVFIGDIVEIRGEMVDVGVIHVSKIRCLAPGARDYKQGDWPRFNRDQQALIRRLEMRSRILTCIRTFFDNLDFIEVETPHLLDYSGCEVHIEQFETSYRSDEREGTLYLAPSPELYMKRLLGVGLERLYQLGRCFRNGERSPLHNPEFTMVEWYRAFASYEEIMADTEALVAYVWSEVAGRHSPLWQSVVEARPWPRISVHQAFEEWVGIDIRQYTESKTFYDALRAAGFASASPSDTWDDLFNKVLIEKIEPNLATAGAIFLYDYPTRLGAMAKQKEADGRWAERAELYLGGVELANGYTELNDPTEQRKRFMQARALQGDGPIDEEFLRAMECAIPPAGGMALGVDRLAMLATGAGSIDDVLPFPMI